MVVMASKGVMKVEFFVLMFRMAQLAADINSFAVSIPGAQVLGVDS